MRDAAALCGIILSDAWHESLRAAYNRFMNILVISELQDSSLAALRAFLDAERLSLGYLAGSTELARKAFSKTKALLAENGSYEVDYYDLDRNFSAETYAELKRKNALFIAPSDVPLLNLRLRERGFRQFLRDYFYIGGKVIACGKSVTTLCENIDLAREWNEIPRFRAQEGLGYLPYEVYPGFTPDPFINARLATLSTHNGGRRIYALSPEGALHFEKGKVSALGKAWIFFQGEMQEMGIPMAHVVHNEVLEEIAAQPAHEAPELNVESLLSLGHQPANA